MRHVPPRCAWAWAAWLAIVPACPQAWAAVSATGVSMSQKNAALEFLQAVASGDPEAVAFAMHPDDLRALRLRILTLLHEEAKRGDSTVRNRLFGPARPLDEIEAQIEDLSAGRHGTSAAARTPAALRGGGRSTAPAQPGIIELLATSEKLLSEGKCDLYYGKQMSPEFRRVTGKKALAALVAACQNGLGTREMLLATLHIVQGLEPRYEYEGQRATYDLTGQGLPFDHFVLEQVDKHWYVAE